MEGCRPKYNCIKLKLFSRKPAKNQKRRSKKIYFVQSIKSKNPLCDY